MLDSSSIDFELASQALFHNGPLSLHGRTLVAFGEKIFFKHAVVTATLVVLIYDYLCTLDREVALVWMRPRTIATYLFVLNRYLPFIDVSLSLGALKIMLSAEGCHRQYSAITWLNNVGVLLTHVILVQRTIAIWEKNAWICSILAVVITGTSVTSIVTAKIFLNSLKFGEPDPAFFYGCVLLSSNSMIKINFINILIAETTIVVLTLIRAITHLRHTRSSWTRRMYRAGFIFYIYIFAITLLNTLFPVFATRSLKTTFSDPQRALHSMLCNRVIFSIFDCHPDGDTRESDDYYTSSSRRLGGGGGGGTDAESGGIVFTTILDTFVTQTPEHEAEPQNDGALSAVKLR